MPDYVIKCIEAITSKEKQDKVLVFTDRYANPIGDNEKAQELMIPMMTTTMTQATLTTRQGY
jgi:hypothetical protein